MSDKDRTIPIIDITQVDERGNPPHPAEPQGVSEDIHASCMICGYDKPLAIWHGEKTNSGEWIGVCHDCRRRARGWGHPPINLNITDEWVRQQAEKEPENGITSVAPATPIAGVEMVMECVKELRAEMSKAYEKVWRGDFNLGPPMDIEAVIQKHLDAAVAAERERADSNMRAWAEERGRADDLQAKLEAERAAVEQAHAMLSRFLEIVDEGNDDALMRRAERWLAEHGVQSAQESRA